MPSDDTCVFGFCKVQKRSCVKELGSELPWTAMVAGLSRETWRKSYYPIVPIDVGFGTFITHDIRIFVEKNDVLRTGPTPRESESLKVALKKKIDVAG